MIGISVHLQLSLFPHLGQLQEHNNNEVLHPTHLVYSAKSSFKFLNVHSTSWKINL